MFSFSSYNIEPLLGITGNVFFSLLNIAILENVFYSKKFL